MRHPIFLSLLSLFLLNCSHLNKNPYESGLYKNSPDLKKSIIPIPIGVSFTVRQGAFGESSHNQVGNEFAWDLEVPYGSAVISAFDGKVFYLYKPSESKHGCYSENRETAWNILIENEDSSVSQYTHVDSTLAIGQKVKKGQMIGHTIESGWICYPHLHYSIYKDQNHLYNSQQRLTVPIFFIGIQDGLLKEGQQYVSPKGSSL